MLSTSRLNGVQNLVDYQILVRSHTKELSMLLKRDG